MSVLEDAANGYLGYRVPQKLEDGSVVYGPWTYEQVDVQYRIAAAKELWDRTDGKAPQAITGADDGPVKVDASAGLLEMFKRMADNK